MSVRHAILRGAALALLPLSAAAQATEPPLDAPALTSRIVMRGVHAGGFPGAAVAFGTGERIVLEQGYGAVDWHRTAEVSATGTAYDVASLTKVLATTAAIMLLVDDGALRLDDPVVRHLPAFAGPGRGGITIRDLLLHRGGLPAAPAIGGPSPVAARQAAARTPLAYAPRSRTLYSDAGAIILGLLAERVAQEPLDRLVHRRVWARAGMTATRFGAPYGRRVAPTGGGGAGTVHDGHARRLGGVAGHAGVFSTVHDVARFAQLMLGGGVLDGRRVFSDSVVAQFTAIAEGGRALGWDGCASGGRCGHRMSAGVVGHTGFTGTSLWIDPEHGVFVIMLANAVHAPRAYDAHAVLSDVRADLADLAVAAAGGGPPLARLRSELAIGWYHPGAEPIAGW